MRYVDCESAKWQCCSSQQRVMRVWTNVSFASDMSACNPHPMKWCYLSFLEQINSILILLATLHSLSLLGQVSSSQMPCLGNGLLVQPFHHLQRQSHISTQTPIDKHHAVRNPTCLTAPATARLSFSSSELRHHSCQRYSCCMCYRRQAQSCWAID